MFTSCIVHGRSSAHARFLTQVVDKKDDDAWGLSNGLSVGVSLSTNDSSFTAEWKLGLTIGLCAVGERL